MKLICKGSRGSDLSAEVLEKSGNTPWSKFNVTIGREYVVHAMALWTYGLGALLVDDTSRPNWKLMEIFEVVDGRLPRHWEFCLWEGREPVLALWGYPSLIRDPSHYDDLINRERPALEVFFRETQARYPFDIDANGSIW